MCQIVGVFWKSVWISRHILEWYFFLRMVEDTIWYFGLLLKKLRFVSWGYSWCSFWVKFWAFLHWSLTTSFLQLIHLLVINNLLNIVINKSLYFILIQNKATDESLDLCSSLLYLSSSEGSKITFKLMKSVLKLFQYSLQAYPFILINPEYLVSSRDLQKCQVVLLGN